MSRGVLIGAARRRASSGGGGVDLLSGLACYLEMEEASGTLTDSSGNGISFAESIGYGSASASAAGIVGQGREIPSGAGVKLAGGAGASAFQVGTGEFTVSLWIKFSSVYYPYVASRGGGGSWTWAIMAASMNTVAFAVSSDGTGLDVATTGGPTLSPGVWYHLVAYVDRATGKIGLIVNNAAPIEATAPASVGSVANWSWYDTKLSDDNSGVGAPVSGIYDEFGYWTRKLTADEITALYNGGAGLAKGSW